MRVSVNKWQKRVAHSVTFLFKKFNATYSLQEKNRTYVKIATKINDIQQKLITSQAIFVLNAFQALLSEVKTCKQNAFDV